MNKTTKTILWVVIAIIIIVGIWYEVSRKPIEKETIKIGWIGALTGDAAIVGQENFRGVELAVGKINNDGGINGKKIILVAQDDKYDPKETINAYQKLFNIDKIKSILVETYGGFIALANIAEKDGVVLIDSIDTSEEFSNLSKNAFAVGVYDESIGFAIADYLNKKNVESIGLLVNISDPFTILVKGALKQKYKEKIYEEEYTFNTKDFRTALNKLSKNSFIVLLGWEETGRIVKQAREMRINAQIIGIDTFATDNFKKNTGGNYEGLLFTFWQGAKDNLKFSEMVSSYRKKYGKDPDNVLFTAVGHDAVSVLADVFKKCDGDETSCIRQNLKNIKNFDGVAGKITIDEDGISRSIRETMHTYRNGQIVPYEE